MAYGTKGREFISWILYTELLGTCALFLILQKGTQLPRNGESFHQVNTRACTHPHVFGSLACSACTAALGTMLTCAACMQIT